MVPPFVLGQKWGVLLTGLHGAFCQCGGPARRFCLSGFPCTWLWLSLSDGEERGVRGASSPRGFAGWLCPSTHSHSFAGWPSLHPCPPRNSDTVSTGPVKGGVEEGWGQLPCCARKPAPTFLIAPLLSSSQLPNLSTPALSCGVRTAALESRPCHPLAGGPGMTYLAGCQPEGCSHGQPWESGGEGLRLSHLEGPGRSVGG